MDDTQFSLRELLLDSVQVVRKNNYFIDVNWQPAGVTEQFMDEADTYQQRYYDRLDFEALMDRCFTLGAIARNKPLRMLDIGSGGGSSVFASCKLLPNAHIVAADISPPLLDILSNFVQARADLRQRVTACCFDLHVPFFRPDCFDVVVGSAILHHLADPCAALSNIALSLKTGGKLILIEPLEAGSLVLTSVFEQVLVKLHHLGLADGPLGDLMRAMRLDIQARLGVPNLKPWTQELDDKWVFDEPYLLLLARQLQLSEVTVYPAQADLTTVYETGFRSLMADSGNAQVRIPPSVLAAIQEFDREISPSLKQKLCPTGIIVLTR